MMKYLLLPIIVLSFLIFTSCSSDKDSMIIEGILYSSKMPVSIEISDGKIIGIKQGQRSIDGSQLIIAPGLIDIQINGYNGIDFSDPDLTTEDLKKIVKGLWEVGVTTDSTWKVHIYPRYRGSAVHIPKNIFACRISRNSSNTSRQQVI
jgi:N-acetylglucosamine-6-phosphate deacetylase